MAQLNRSDSSKWSPLSEELQSKAVRHRMQEWTVHVQAGPLTVAPVACVLPASEMDVRQWVMETSAVH